MPASLLISDISMRILHTLYTVINIIRVCAYLIAVCIFILQNGNGQEILLPTVKRELPAIRVPLPG